MYQTSSSTSPVCTITNCLVVILLIRLVNELVVSSNCTWYLVKLPNVLVILWTVNLLVYLVTTTSYFFQCTHNIYQWYVKCALDAIDKLQMIDPAFVCVILIIF